MSRRPTDQPAVLTAASAQPTVVTCSTGLSPQIQSIPQASPFRSNLSVLDHDVVTASHQPILIIVTEIIQEMSSRGGKLAPDVNRALFVKNLSYNVTPEELFDLFGKFGPIRQVRQGISTSTKGTAFVVYEDVMDAKQACDKLNGFNFQNRYLVVLYHQPDKMAKSKEDLEARRESLAQLKKQHGID
ncbi:hypothetical protein DCS_04690 [Drechmeria coniospora]|uniref:RRM domain-containing protein n=1 Tax=Drechmeria coniospora TaxID=98403 RepID=A0A151GKR1_DRECN|nr:hypothetical protein DCS_04690 [Drechmeria coniospora]KYK57678.1 hypothetical protein DCS_04690 [Drechmeria coniospora]